MVRADPTLAKRWPQLLTSLGHLPIYLGLTPPGRRRNRAITDRGIAQTIEAALRFALAIVEKRGWVSDEDVQRVRAAGFADREIAEVVATVAHTMFSNYFNHVAGTEVDFPAVEMGGRAAA